jgi:hypothetical protein
MTQTRPTVGAAIEGGEAIILTNRTAHRVTFWVQGITPEVGMTLDGNTRYSTRVIPDPKSTTIVVRLDGPNGQILAQWPDPKEGSHG